MNPVDVSSRQAACDALCAGDPALARAYDVIGLPDWRATEPIYQSLARTIVYQLISTKAGDAIWGRVQTWAGGEVTHHAILDAEEETLRSCGLSGPKIRHMKSVADAVHSEALPLDALHDMNDADARKCLIAVKGIGPWTAELFMMCALKKMDAFPEGDVGLMESLRLLQDTDERLSPKAFLKHAESWRPYRGMAAHLLWGYINHLRAEDR